MNRKSIAALAVAAVMTVGVGASSYAWFTSQATSVNNVVQTGTLVIGGPSGTATLKHFTLNNLYPGKDGSKSENITIRNNGSINLKYTVSSTFKSGEGNLYNIANVAVKNNSGVILYNGKLNLLNKALANKSLLVGEAETLNFTVSLPESADNQYQGKAANVDFVFDASQLTFVNSPLTGVWDKDRTLPETWNIDADNWITYSTQTEPANEWKAWQGKGMTTNNVLAKNWKVETEIQLTDDLLKRDGVRTSMWLQVLDEAGVEIDWSILQFKIDNDNQTKGWQYWDESYVEDGVNVGQWKDIATDTPTTAGVYKLAIAYDNGNVIGFINGIQVFSYPKAESKLTSVQRIIFNSYSFGESYEVKWKVPTVSYVAQ
jgi:predicted ribosomally synthesized peptide with SipW-like signal peptide